MKRLVNTKNMEITEWLRWRRSGVCGSDASIILGLNPYRSVLELWKDKTEQIPIEEKSNNFTHFGHLLEPVIRKEFERQTGMKVSVRNAIFQSRKYPWMLADIDGIVTEHDGSKALFEAKTAIEYKKGIWDEGNIPDAYYAQVQHYLEVCELDTAYIACLVGGNSFYWYKIEKDEEYIHWLIRREENFWTCVQDLTVPDIDGSKATTNYLGEMYADTVDEEIALPEEAKGIAEKYLTVDTEIKNLTKEKDLLGNQLKGMLQEHEVGTVGTYRVLWASRKRTSVDTKKLKENLGESYDEYLKEIQYRQLSVAA